MLQVVLDTNVIISALLKAAGLENQVLRLGLNGIIKLCMSATIFAEYASVLVRPRLKFQSQEIHIILEQLRETGEFFHPAHTLAVCSHEPDDRLLECAEAAQANFLVTGNKRHFPQEWKTIQVVNAREFIEYFTARQSR